ncbi:hypothetical protein QM127_25685, partial [Enterobacter hormaechei]|nr:hypothetical protein [Enterobacter hormaechei]
TYPRAREHSLAIVCLCSVRYRKWQIVDHSTHTLSFLNQAAELNLVTVTMTEGSEENAQMQESHENNSKPPAWRLFYICS